MSCNRIRWFSSFYIIIFVFYSYLSLSTSFAEKANTCWWSCLLWKCGAHTDAFTDIPNSWQGLLQCSILLAKYHNETLYGGRTMTTSQRISYWTKEYVPEWGKTTTTIRRQNIKQAQNNFRHLGEVKFLMRHFCGFVFSEGSFSFFPILFRFLSHSSKLPVFFFFVFLRREMVPTLFQLYFSFLHSCLPNCCFSCWINAESRLHWNTVNTDMLSSTWLFGI